MNLKKLNRGLVLGAVLIVGTAVYVCIDNANFSKSKDEIENVVTSFYSEIPSVNLGDSEDVPEKAKALINKYFAYDSEAAKNITGIDTQLEFADENVDEIDHSGSFSECEYSLTNIKVKKNGPNGAVVTLDVNEYDVFNGMPIWYCPSGGVEAIDNENYFENDSNYMENNPDESITYTRTANYYSVIIKLMEIDGEWKIVSYEDYGWDCNISQSEISDTDSADTAESTDSTADESKSEEAVSDGE